MTIGFLINYEKQKFIDYKSNINPDGGNYIKLTYIGSSHCYFSKNIENNRNVIKIKQQVKELAIINDYKFISSGISVDFNAYQGIKFLEKTGPYDEIIVGNNWFNEGVFKYVWDGFQGRPATPQIIISNVTYEVEVYHGIKKSETVLKRFNGGTEIKNFLQVLKENQETGSAKLDILNIMKKVGEDS